jgi:Uma2 family endonuclease
VSTVEFTRTPEQYARHRHRWTVAEYYKMGEVGLFNENTPVELIEGDIIEMAPIGSSHSGTVNYINRCFSLLLLQGKAIVALQNPIRLSANSEPQPDIVLLRWRDDFYRKTHPLPEEVLLAIEVADSTVRYDREVKIPLYARSSIPEVWLVNLLEHCVEVYLTPQEDRYQTLKLQRKGDISPAAFPDVSIKLAELFKDV